MKWIAVADRTVYLRKKPGWVCGSTFTRKVLKQQRKDYFMQYELIVSACSVQRGNFAAEQKGHHLFKSDVKPVEMFNLLTYQD